MANETITASEHGQKDEQILSVNKLNGFGDDNFSEYKFDLKDPPPQGEEVGSDSDSSEITARSLNSDTEGSEVTVRVSDSDSLSHSSTLSSQDSSNTNDFHDTKIASLGLPPPPAKISPRSRDIRYPGPDIPEGIKAPSNLSAAVGALNTCQTNSVNTTIIQDENSKYFTVIHDVAPRGARGPCKKCPKMQIVSLKEWWKIQQNLNPRARHSLRVSLIVVGSALLLLAIFLLARLPNSPPDVSSPLMYDLPADDVFRPAHSQISMDPLDTPHLKNIDLAIPIQMREHDFHHSYPENSPPVRLPSLRNMTNRKVTPFHPKLSVPVDRAYLKMEASRRAMMTKLVNSSLSYAEKVSKVALELVQETVNDERKDMEKIEQSIWAEGVTPLKVLLVSTWRSGSTFLGQVLQQHPGVFQHYEPFSYMGVKQIRSGAAAFQSQQLLHRLMECRFKGQDQYLNYIKAHPLDMVGHNQRIYKSCKFSNYVEVCTNATFLTDTCNMFPIQLVKTVRLRLNLTQLFLGENRLNAKVVFLVRDPRATMNSRLSSVDWCSNSDDCSNPDTLCSDLKDDLKVSAAFERLYPNSFIRVKYEDLANEPQKVVKNLLTFLGMEFTKELSEFVKSHTESDVNAPWSVARKSAARVSRWKENLNSEQIHEIEKVCRPVIESLNYEIE